MKNTLEIKNVEPLNKADFSHKGKVWIGDPCYVIDNDSWADLCEYDQISCRDSRDGVVVTTDKGKFFMCSTAYGDGAYPVTQGGKHIGNVGVDSGTLSIIPIEMLEYTSPHGMIVEASGPAEADGGDFECGDIEVATGGDSDDDDELDDDEELYDDDEEDDCCGDDEDGDCDGCGGCDDD